MVVNLIEGCRLERQNRMRGSQERSGRAPRKYAKASMGRTRAICSTRSLTFDVQQTYSMRLLR